MSDVVNKSRIVERLERFPRALEAAVAIVTPDDARWKPAPVHWSILEICCHLLDEEREDFRVRLESTLRDPDAAWPPLALDQVAEKRGYNQRDLIATVQDFADERRKSVAWLGSLSNPDWSKARIHPKIGPIHAGALLASWAAHDALHMRQIAKRLHGLAGRDGGPYSTRYAGEWGP
jgi:hypothetical protein